MILLLLSNTFTDERVSQWHSPLLGATALGTAAPVGGGGAGKFDNLSRGMIVVDEEAWEDEGIILPLMLDDFP